MFVILGDPEEQLVREERTFISESLQLERESSKAGNVNASGTGSLRVSAQGLSCSRLL